MKEFTATSPDQVRTWVESIEHHEGRWLNSHMEDVLHPRESAYFELRNYHEALRIPVAVHEKCFLKVLCDGKRMFSWDFEAEQNACRIV